MSNPNRLIVAAAFIGGLAGPPLNSCYAANAAAPALSREAIAALGMSRQLAGEHLLTMSARRHRVLGTNQLLDSSGRSQTVLLVRDELSGQISYYLPGLQFSLKDGVDYEAFIREYAGLTRLFVNTMYAQVGVDAAEIANRYAALSADGRVVKLRLMSRSPVAQPK